MSLQLDKLAVSDRISSSTPNKPRHRPMLVSDQDDFDYMCVGKKALVYFHIEEHRPSNSTIIEAGTQKKLNVK